MISFVAALSAIATGCGSTVPITQQQAAETAAAQGLGVEGLAVGEGAGGVGAGASGSGGSGTAAGGSGGGAATGGAAAVDPGKSGPGITASTIKVGIMYAADQDEANAALGAAGATGLDSRSAFDAIFDDMNKNGGFGGLKIIPVFHEYRALSSKTADQQDQEACAHWTQDDPVFISDGGLKTENGMACLERAGLVSVASNGLRFRSDGFFSRYPHFVEFDGIDNDDLSRMYVDGMKKLDYFDSGAKIGLLTWDDPEYAGPMASSLIPRLKEHGLNPTDVAYIKMMESNEDTGEVVAQVGNAALRFKSEGIDHVMFLDQGANLAFFFMQAAQRQQYAPRYGLTTASGNTTLADLLAAGGNTQDARSQLKDAVSVGWIPTLDVRPDDLPAWANTQTKSTCYGIMRDNGIKMDSSNARTLAESVCDTAWTMKATIEASGRVINQSTFLAGLDAVSDKLQPTSGMGIAISQSRHDGNATAAYLKFYDSCVCFRYISDRFPVPD